MIPEGMYPAGALLLFPVSLQLERMMPTATFPAGAIPLFTLSLQFERVIPESMSLAGARYFSLYKEPYYSSVYDSNSNA